VKELAESRNQADALVHSTRKSLTEYGDKLEAGEKEKIEAAITDLEARSSRATRPRSTPRCSAVDRFAEAGREDVRRHAGAAAAGGAKARPAASRPSHKTTWSTLTSRKSKTASNRHPRVGGDPASRYGRSAWPPACAAHLRSAGSAFRAVQNTARCRQMAKRDFYEVLGVAKAHRKTRSRRPYRKLA
jgi:hypothetical protein